MTQLDRQTDPILAVNDLNLYYGSKQALKGITLPVLRNQVTAFIGPSGCGKSTLLRCFNRMNDLVDSVRIEGSITFEGEELNSPDQDVISLRRRIGMVFQQSNPFPKSIYEKHCVRPAYRRNYGQGDAGRNGGTQPEKRCHLG